MTISLTPLLLYLVFSNIVIRNIASGSNIRNLQDMNIEEIDKVVMFHVLPKGPVSWSGPSHPPSRDLHKTIQNKHFHVLPKEPVPWSGPSHLPPHPPSRDLHRTIQNKHFHVLPKEKGPVPWSEPSHPPPHPSGRDLYRTIQNKHFHLLPKGHVRPSGPLPGCSTPPHCAIVHI